MTDHSKSTKKTSKSQLTDKKTNLILGSVIATLIAITPYIFYSYESVPEEKIWNTFLFTYNSGYYENALASIWTMMGKLVPLYLLFIWFFTCRHWWFHVLLIPIAMYAYQLFSIVNDDLKYIDEYQIIILIPIMAVIIPSIYLIRAKMFNKLTSKNMQELEDEFRISRKTFKDFF